MECFPNLCMKVFLSSAVALLEVWQKLFSAFLFSVLSQIIPQSALAMHRYTFKGSFDWKLSKLDMHFSLGPAHLILLLIL